MDAWCGPFGSAGWISHTLSPCVFETSAAVLLWTVALALIAAQWARLTTQPILISNKQGPLGLEAGNIAACGFICLLHAVHFIVAAITHTELLFHTAYQAALAVLWATVCGFGWRLSKTHAAIDLRCATFNVTVIGPSHACCCI